MLKDELPSCKEAAFDDKGCKVTVFIIQCINQKHSCHKNENKAKYQNYFWKIEKENKEFFFFLLMNN